MELSCDDMDYDCSNFLDMESEEMEAESLQEIKAEAKVAKSSLSELIPDVKRLKNNVFKAQTLLNDLNAKQNPRIKRLMCQLEALQPLIMEMQSDVTEIKQDIKTVLNVRCDDMDSFTSEPPQALENADGHVDGSHDTKESESLSVSQANMKPCYICGEWIRNRNSHMLQCHPLLKPFSCLKCRVAFDNFRDFRKHKAIHKVTTVRCDLCNKIMKGLKTLKRHIIAHMSENFYMCDVCGKFFRCEKSVLSCKHKPPNPSLPVNGDWLRGNELLKTEGNDVVDKALDIEKDNRADDKGLDEVEASDKYNCIACPKTFSHKKSLKRHQREEHNNFPVSCLVCKRSFVTLHGLRNHIKVHKKESTSDSSPKYEPGLLYGETEMNSKSLSHESTPVQCETCGLVCDNFYLLKFHVKSIHLDLQKTHICETCGKAFESGRQLARHRNIHHKGEKFSCQYCMNTFRKRRAYEQHINVHTGEKPFECKVCHKRFPSLSSRQNHTYRIHTKGYLYLECAVCNKKFPSNFVRETHYLKHTEEELINHNIVVTLFKCDICGKVVRKEYFKRHRATHSKERTFVCEVCGKKFKNFSGLRQHSIRHNDVEEGLFMHNEKGPNLCEICGKGYSTPAYLEQHKLLHSGETAPHECNVCGKQFLFKSFLDTHKMIHTDVKSYVCNVCGKAFKIKGQLTLHKKIHTGEEPFRCSICGKGFLFRHSLKSHEIAHTSSKSFNCELCDMSFTYHTSLTRHMKTHTQEKPYQCDFCGKSFHVKNVMQVHRRIHTGEKPFHCEICNKQFSDPSTAFKHKATHTKETPQVFEIYIT
ncbi:Zinc finger protein 729 [Plakobranchus ocellatus]|uniref:Zinc finger protein 729 n=1 Tax=Plakobranchus ocellatus TaxID=259542 RepID=A0AAV4C1B0_9GAST|nr:Zinc finger protein 729 [Plakobranchus ocellatus]